MSRTATKDRVYIALAAGINMREAARKLKIHEKSVRRHAADLVARGVLAKVKGGTGAAITYQRGAKAQPYESTIPNRGGQSWVGSTEGAPKVAIRVHRGGYAFQVRGDAARVPWAREWHPTKPGARPYQFRVEWEGVGFWLVKERAKPHRLHVELPDEIVYDPAEVAEVAERREARALDAASRFAAEFSFKFASTKGYRYLPLEYAAEMPGLEVFGSPGESFVWVDGSPGDGRLEMETQEPEFAKLMLEWPDVLRRLAETEQHVVVAHQAIHGLLGLQEKVVGVLTPKPGKAAKALPPSDDPAVA